MFRGVRTLLTSCFLFPLPDSLFIVALGKLKNRWDKSQTINTTTELTSSFSNVTHPFWPQNQVYLLKSGVQQRDHSSFDMQKKRWFCWVQECSTMKIHEILGHSRIETTLKIGIFDRYFSDSHGAIRKSTCPETSSSHNGLGIHPGATR